MTNVSVTVATMMGHGYMKLLASDWLADRGNGLSGTSCYE